jgi:hypothetical protein
MTAYLLDYCDPAAAFEAARRCLCLDGCLGFTGNLS